MAEFELDCMKFRWLEVGVNGDEISTGLHVV